MPLLSQEQVIKQYWDQVKDKYPDLDYAKFQEVCKSPFLFIKECIRSGDLPIIMIKYLGKFRVYSSRIKKLMKVTQDYRNVNAITEDTYNEKMNFLKAYLEKLELEKEKTSTLNLEDDEEAAINING